LYNRFFNYFNSLKDNIAVGIVTLKPLKDSDLILVYNLNLKEVSSIINQMRGRTLVLLTIIRLVSANSNKLLEEKVLSLEYNAQSLAKLNESISSYQERLEQQSEETQTVKNNKLKIQVKPKSEVDIIIGKNKASAFKQWLDL